MQSSATYVRSLQEQSPNESWRHNSYVITYDVIILDYDITNKILSRDSNYIANVVMWPKFGNSSVSVRQVAITSIL